MLDLQLYKTFITVLQAGNCSNAAAELNYAQSTVTKHIQLLEAAYGGAALLVRQGNKMIPTEQGRILSRHAAQILSAYEASLREIAVPEARTLRLGTTAALSERYVPAFIRQVKTACPDVAIQLTAGNPPLLRSLLLNGQLDAAFLMDTAASAGKFASRIIHREQLVIAVRRGHPLSEVTDVSFDNIKEQPFILTENGCGFRRFLIDEFALHNAVPQIAMELDSIAAIKQAVAQGYGIGFIPSFLLEEDDMLIPLPYKTEQADLYSMVLYTPGDLCTPSFMTRAIEKIR